MQMYGCGALCDGATGRAHGELTSVPAGAENVTKLLTASCVPRGIGRRAEAGLMFRKVADPDMRLALFVSANAGKFHVRVSSLRVLVFVGARDRRRPSQGLYGSALSAAHQNSASIPRAFATW
jgi:hypothetical protein